MEDSIFADLERLQYAFKMEIELGELFSRVFEDQICKTVPDLVVQYLQ